MIVFLVSSLFGGLVKLLLYLSLIISLCSYLGWIRRFLCCFAEDHFSREVFNGAPVTIGSLELSLGTVLATNVIVHTSKRKDWKWESPLVLRVGRVWVEWNMLGFLWSFVCLEANALWTRGCHAQEAPPMDLYSIELSDTQVFVERHQHVFNFHLLDPYMVLPDPADNDSFDHENTDDDDDDDVVTLEDDASEEQQQVEQQAQELVHEMFSAVRSVGQRGAWRNAWRTQKERLTLKLKEWQQTPNKSDAMQEGVKVMQHVGKAVVENTRKLQPVVLAATKPERQIPDDAPPVPTIRMGRVRIRNARVFTRNYNKASRWNKPIVIGSLVVRPAELCPPLSLLDEKGNPAIYQPIDKVLDVVLRRVLAEMAKSQTGRLLHTAVGELLGCIEQES